ncbi:MAG: hypothetical protein LBS52_07010 [Dysgonamonadaceae bacterium]|jgi:hypothetical protein|nr:hypothetical protein [Dysgonamonadaceae bacterium]
MRNKRLSGCFLAGLLLIAGMFFDNASAQSAGDSIATKEATIEEIAEDFAAAESYFHDEESTLLNDSLLQVVPIDTASVLARRFEGKLAEKYASDKELNFERNNSKSFLQKLKEWLGEFARDLLGYGDEADIDKITNTVLDIFYILLFLAVVYIAVRLIMNHKGRWFFEKADEAVPIDLTNVEQHIHEADFPSLLKEAEQAGDTRQSVRLLYLWTLKTFADSKIIAWNADKTNIDYLGEIKDEGLKSDFNYLSYLYNYIWYGEFAIDSKDYQNAREKFRKHIRFNNE